MLTLLLALLSPPVLYRLFKWFLGPRPHNVVRTEEDYRIMWEIACKLYDERLRSDGRCQRTRRHWYHLLSYTITLILLMWCHQLSPPPSPVLIPPLECTIEATETEIVTSASKSLVALLLGINLPVCSTLVDNSEYCLVGSWNGSTLPYNDFFINHRQTLYLLTPTGGAVAEFIVLDRLARLNSSCLCPSQVGLTGVNVTFLRRSHQQQEHWVLLYEPVLLRNLTSTGQLIRTLYRGLETVHYSDLMIEFSAVVTEEETDLLLQRYNERLYRHNLTVLKRIEPHRERLPLRLQGDEAACFSHCLQHHP